MKKKISKTKYTKFEKDCLNAIEKNGITFLDEIFTFVKIQPSEFFEYNLQDSTKIKDAIDINRAKLKRDLRAKWLDSTNATLNAALYKLVCTEEEKKSLSSSSSTKNSSNNDNYTQEEYLKSLKEMSEETDNADWLDKIKIQQKTSSFSKP